MCVGVSKASTSTEHLLISLHHICGQPLPPLMWFFWCGTCFPSFIFGVAWCSVLPPAHLCTSIHAVVHVVTVGFHNGCLYSEQLVFGDTDCNQCMLCVYLGSIINFILLLVV